MDVMAERSEHVGDVDTVRVADPEVGKALAKRSLKLERVAVSFVVDAKDFFEECVSHPEWTWTELESLSLTFGVLGFALYRGTWQHYTPGHKEIHKRVNKLLLDASAVVRRMPKLKILEIWDGGEARASVFRYELDNGAAAVTWKCAPQVELLDEAVEAWEAAARDMGAREFTAVSQALVQALLWSHGHAIRQLGLKIPVLDAGSEAQIVREHFGL